MTLDEFRHHADAWGGRLERWPEELRAPARALAEHSGEARRMLADAELMDARLALAVDLPVAGNRVRDAASKVMARIAEADDAQTASWWLTLRGWLLPAGGFAVAAGLGVALAVVMEPPPLTGRETTLISAILDSGALAEDLVVQ